MDLDEYGSMRAMLYSYALTYALPGSLQEQINEAEGETEIILNGPVSETLVIPDDKDIILNLNGQTLTPERRLYEGGSMSAITVFGSLKITGNGTITLGDEVKDDDFRGITVSDGGNLIFESGSITGFGVKGNGGGVLVENKGHFEMTGGNVSGNTAQYRGGGVYAYETAIADLKGGSIDGNSAENGGGIAYGILSEGGYTLGNDAGSTLTVENNAASNYGGGIYISEVSGEMTWKDNAVAAGNQAKAGGGLYFASAVTFQMTGGRVEGNTATEGNGGGLWMPERSSFTMEDGVISGNRATGILGNPKASKGGGVYLDRYGSFTMSGGQINGNRAATWGGGVALMAEFDTNYYYTGSFVMTGGQISGNSLGEEGVLQGDRLGAGVAVGRDATKVEISGEAQILDNTGATHGGGIYVRSGASDGVLVQGNALMSGNRAEANDDTYYGYGGGLFSDSPVTMKGGSIRDNYARNNGGGVYAFSFTLEEGEICQNKSDGSAGGLQGGSPFIMTGGEIYENESKGDGGGVCARNPEIRGGAIYGNIAGSRGGGLWVSGSLLMESGKIYGNRSGSNGGGIYSESGSEHKMTGGEVTENISGNNGGGVACYYGFFRMSGGKISGNTAGWGGGIYSASNKNGRGNCGGKRLEITETAQVTGNSATYSGGGAYVEWGKVEISGGEITGNKALNATNSHAYGYGGGIYASSTVPELKITGGTIKDNTAKQCGKDIYGISAYNADLERFSFEIEAASEMGGGTESSIWKDELGGEQYAEAFDNKADVKELTEADADEEIAANAKPQKKYAYTFIYENTETVAEVVAEGKTTEYPSVQAAVKAIADSDAKENMIKMVRDNRESVVIPGGTKITLDLNGHTLKGELSSVIEVAKGAELTIKDSSAKDGKGGTGSIEEGEGKRLPDYNNDTYVRTYGGGLFVYGKAVLESGTIKNNGGYRSYNPANNYDTTKGGGVYVAEGGTFEMKGGSIEDNTGAGVQVYTYLEKGASVDNAAHFTMTGGKISGNSQRGVDSHNDTKTSKDIEIRIAGGEISGNKGGVFIYGGTLEMTGGTIKENTANGGHGGGIDARYSNLTVGGGSLQKNTATYDGGGLYVQGSSSLSVGGTTISENMAGRNGGGIFWDGWNYGAAEITGETVLIDNEANGFGGGIYAGRSIDLANCRIQDNSADLGGGVYQAGYTLSMQEGAVLYRNKKGIRPDDIYVVKNATVGSLLTAEEMVERQDKKSYTCWVDYVSGTVYREMSEIEELREALAKTGTAYDLAVSDGSEIEKAVCEILVEATEETQDDTGYISKDRYTSLAIAMEEALRLQTENTTNGVEQEIVVRLLVDHHTESVQIPADLRVTLDLNGKTLHPVRNDYTIYVNAGADLTVNGNMLSGNSENETTWGILAPLDPNSGKASRGIYVAGSSADKDAKLADLTLRNIILRDFSGNNQGGGIYGGGYYGLDLDGVRVENCSATGNGGGIFAYRRGQNYSDHAFMIRNTTVENCRATDNGGGIYIYVEWLTDDSDDLQISVENCRITGNKLTGSRGGGMYVGTNSNRKVQLSIVDTEIDHNEATHYGAGLSLARIRAYLGGTPEGGDRAEGSDEKYMTIHDNKVTGIWAGLYIENAVEDPEAGNVPWRAKLDHVKIYRNSADSNGGGASISSSVIDICNTEVYENSAGRNSYYGGLAVGGKIDMRDSIVRDNRDQYSGGLLISGAGAEWPVTLNNVTVSGNHAKNQYGGGVSIGSSTGRKLLFENCDITGNSGGSDGGGMYFYPMWDSEIIFKGTRISGNSAGGWGGGIYIDQNGYDDRKGSTFILEDGTRIEKNSAGGHGGGIAFNYWGSRDGYHILRIEEGASVNDNRATNSGGGIYVGDAKLEMIDGEVRDNRSENNGGGICMSYYNHDEADGRHYYSAPQSITGGKITGNTAKNDGGGIYVGELMDNVVASGGEITGNQAGRYGGGVAQYWNNTHFNLEETEDGNGAGKLYDNAASLGQDYYGYYNNNTSYKTYINLVAAKDMFSEEDIAHQGIGWLDERENVVTTPDTEIRGRLSSYYALTLRYGNKTKMVAEVNGQQFSSVQEAVDYVRIAQQNGGDEENVWANGAEAPVVKMIDDSSENVILPVDVTMTLNLNGKTLRGYTTAISCQGNLTIVDEKEDVSDQSVGTITGSGVEAGGGIMVSGGGSVTMRGGQIADCYAATAGNSSWIHGGGAVCVDAGTFILEGEASLNHNISGRGSAVMVRNTAGRFVMRGGEIRENTGSYGTIVVNSGSVEITGGTIEKNKVDGEGGAIYVYTGSLNINGTTGSKVEIKENEATWRGGGIYINTGKVNLKNVEIWENKTAEQINSNVLSYAGGGICMNEGTLDIGTGTSIMNNRAGRGGGIYQRGTGTVYMIDGLITKNLAEMGGGVAQNPEAKSRFYLMGGGVYDNQSMSSSGNDFYSQYEGTGQYPTNQNTPTVALIRAADMNNGNNKNAWKNDAYDKKKGEEGYNRIGETIQDGQYVIKEIKASTNVQLTATRYEYDQEIESDLLTDKEVTGIVLSDRTDTVKTGSGGFDADDVTKSSEKTAGELAADATQTEWTTGDDGLVHYSGEDSAFLKDFGKGSGVYEPAQMVAWTPGNDSNRDNTLIRTFDEVTYPFTVSMQKIKAETPGETVSGGNAPGSAETESKGGFYRLWFRAALSVDVEKAEFMNNGIIDAMQEHYYVIESVDGERVLLGYVDIEKTDAMRDTMQYSNAVTVRINGMKNGETLKPTFTCWLDNGTGISGDGAKRGECASDRLTVSAAAKYNVTMDYNSSLSYTGYFNLDTGAEASAEERKDPEANIVYGTMLGYGITASLYNDTASGKGLKGLEVPADGMEFDLRFKGGLYLNGEPLKDSETGKDIVAAPYLWAYKENEDGNYGRKPGASTPTFNMNWNDEDDVLKGTSYAYNAAPYNNTYKGAPYGCYNGGSWELTDATAAKQTEGIEERVAHVRLSGYTINYENNAPTRVSGAMENSGINVSDTMKEVLGKSYVKPFSAGYVQVLFPMDPKVVPESDSGYLTIAMETAVTGTTAKSASGMDGVSNDDEKDKENLKKYFGVNTLNPLPEGLATGEVYYKDNYSNNQFGTYVLRGSGEGDYLEVSNYFLNEDRSTLSGSSGTASTPLMSRVYIGGGVQYLSKQISTTDPKDKEHYIAPEDFNTQSDNLVEYNYMTALNILQKFDAEAYTPIGWAEPIIDEDYSFDNKIGANKADISGSFSIGTTEEATSWSKTKTKQCKLSILYAAKPDGSNWVKDTPLAPIVQGDTAKPDDGGSREMDAYPEEKLIYFTTLKDLYDYFGTDKDGNPAGHCVAILYEFRDCCIRTERSVNASAKVQVNSDFEMVGNTYCTTNDIRCWSKYRPVYKELFRENPEGLKKELYTFTWEQNPCGAQNGVTAYGAGNSFGEKEKELAAFCKDKKLVSTQDIWKGYIKTRYANGDQVPGTHNGWLVGNSLLIKTLEPTISIMSNDGVAGASVDTRKETYDISKGERIIEYELRPSLTAAAGLEEDATVSGGKLSTRIRIEVTLPNKLAYRPGSLRFDYTGSGYADGALTWEIEEPDKTAQGPTKLYLYTDISNIYRQLPKIYLKADIGDRNNVNKDVKAGDILTTTARIVPMYGENHQMAAQNSKPGTYAIRIQGDYVNGGYISTETPLRELGEEMSYDLHYTTKNDRTDNIEFVDVLPYNGDARGTAIHGGYQVERVEVIFNSEADFEAYTQMASGEENQLSGALGYLAGQTVSAKEDEAKREAATLRGKMRAGTLLYGTDENVRKDSGTRTVTYNLHDKDLVQKEDGTGGIALYVRVPKLTTAVSGGYAGFRVRVVLKPVSGDTQKQKAGDLYGDSFFFSTGGGEMLPSDKEEIRVVGRSISGIVWMDQAHDGVYAEGKQVGGQKEILTADRVMSGVKVELWKETTDSDGTKQYVAAADVYGNPVASTVTDENGRYEFDDLDAGTYKVKVSEGAGDGYTIKSKDKTQDVTPISFERLSLTELSSRAGTSKLSNGNYAVADYGTNKDTAQGPAGLEAAYIDEITLPEKGTIKVFPYVSGNWNAGLYYIDQAIFKNWNNMTTEDIGKTYSAVFKVEGAYKASDQIAVGGQAAEGNVSGFTLEYEVSGKKEAEEESISCEVKGTGDNKDTAKAIWEDSRCSSITGLAVPGTLATEADVQTYTWKLDGLALQAEGRSGEISYKTAETTCSSIERSGLFGLGRTSTSLEGFITEERRTGEGTAERTYTADNTQILYEIDLRKLGEMITVDDGGNVVWSGSENLQAVLQAGAEFGVYKEAGCTGTPFRTITIDKGAGSVVSLPGGTYYVKEINPPVFYETNESVFRLNITYIQNTDQSDETKLNAAVLPDIKLTEVKRGAETDITSKLTVDGEAMSSAKPVALLKNHTIGFAVEDELVTGEIKLHKVDGNGKALKGVRFKLERQDAGVLPALIAEQMTDESGDLRFEGLKPGTYILTEAATTVVEEEGMNSLLMHPVTITLPYKVSEAEVNKESIATDGEDVVYDGTNYYFYTLNYEISNEAVLKLPETGGVAGAAPIAAVTLLLMAGGYLAIRRRKKGNA